MKSAHIWGCPAYVLQATLQDKKKLPRWSPRSDRVQFLGHSKRHASTVGPIKNIKTGFISSQFHVVYDDNFETITSTDEEQPGAWKYILKFNRECVFEEDDEDTKTSKKKVD